MSEDRFGSLGPKQKVIISCSTEDIVQELTKGTTIYLTSSRSALEFYEVVDRDIREQLPIYLSLEKHFIEEKEEIDWFVEKAEPFEYTNGLKRAIKQGGGYLIRYRAVANGLKGGESLLVQTEEELL